MKSDDDNRYPCPCCGLLTMDGPTRDTYIICPVCGWEDDDIQFNHPDHAGGANHVSLNEARANYAKFGASDKDSLKRVRPPLPHEMP